MTTNSFELFKLLSELGVHDTTYYSSLDDENKKKVQPLVVMRWLTGTQNKQQVYVINECANPYIFSLYRHKDLLVYLLSACTTGKTLKYTWPRQKSSGSGKNTSVRVICEYLHYSSSHAKDILPLISKEDILTMANELGYQKEDISAINKEWK